tara:strand:- start:46877 stop:47500 length:624 start_codon:yes stop_codon:yes gene_type:complete
MGFTINKIEPKKLELMKQTGVWREECPVHYSRLKTIEVTFCGFDGNQKEGTLVVLDILAEQVLSIFQELLDIQFSINKILPIEEFGGDDLKSMKANNSSAFNGRLVARTNRWSSHAFGAAIDVNPIQNPYLLLNDDKELVEVIPPEGSDFLDRSEAYRGMVEEIVPIFAKHGFTEWGGSWEEKPDYHHFQIPWDDIQKLFPEFRQDR